MSKLPIVERLKDACIDWDGRPMVDAEEPLHVPNCGELREAATTITELVSALEAFVNVKDQMPETLKLIDKRRDGFSPVTVTVTKAQFIAAVTALSNTRGDTK